ncbi:haloacid dehalogenase [Rhizobium sp. Root149]|nr:haloacid dehalogenase [Rhizobium sp. Root149]
MLTPDTACEAKIPLADPAVLEELSSEPQAWALFLDIDGTLIDLAETPEAVVVPDGLISTLSQISNVLGGAVGLVTGRAVSFADQLFSPLALPIAGLHGAERRNSAGDLERLPQDDDFEALKRSLVRVTADWDGVIIEDKGSAVAAHYRQAQQWAGALDAVMQSAVEEAGADYTLQRGKMVIEIRPARASKGEALRAFLDAEPFLGRKPIAIGDDLTDEAMFKVANELGGLSIRIGELRDTAAVRAIPSPDALRKILADLARQA